MFESIVEIVAEHAVKNPKRLCIVDTQGEYTYKKVWELTRIIAEEFQKLQLKERDCVMAECTQDARFLICKLACELKKIIFVPIERRASEERIKDILKDTEAKLFICLSEYDIPAKTISIESLPWLQEEAAKAFCSFPKAEDTAEILYTTGTTGKSKGIEITNKNNIALAENVKYGTQMKENNVEFLPLPLSHSHGLRCFYANVLNGSTIVLMEGVSRIKNVFDMIENYKVTAMDLSPSAILIMARLAKEKFYEINAQIDYIQVGTTAVQEDVKALLVKFFPASRLYNFYGSTESGRSSILDFSKDREKICCIGKPTKNAEFIVTDEERNPIHSSKSNMGLLASTGPMNMKGYWKQDELTKQTMQGGYIYTNDIGYIDEEGYIYVLGRRDDVIDCRGIKIAPEEIEVSARKYDGILDCACVPKKDAVSGQVPVLYVVVQDKRKFQKNKLIRFLGQYIDKNKVPKEVKIIDEIPRTYNGKIHRIKLIDKDGKE